MKLIHIESQKPIAEFVDGKSKFFSPIMAWDMKNNGIAIPLLNQKDFDNQFLIYLDDPKFPNAFKEIYYTMRMNTTEYEWIE